MRKRPFLTRDGVRCRNGVRRGLILTRDNGVCEGAIRAADTAAGAYDLKRLKTKRCFELDVASRLRLTFAIPSHFCIFVQKSMRMKRIAAFLTAIICSVAVFADSAFFVSGRVVDSDGEGIPGVTVEEKGTLNGTLTDFDGCFQLYVSNGNSVIVFSYVGKQTVEMTASQVNRVGEIVMWDD